MDTSTFDNPLHGLIADDQAPSKEAAAVQHCLVYLSAELRKLGLGQAAKLVDDAVRQVSDVQRFCDAERRYQQDMPSTRRRPPGSADMHAAYMVPGE
ncbi:MAG: hypothetical protein ACFCVH_07780 [Alphaproteobacteria bacterium]